MTIMLRIVLIVVSVLTTILIMRKIRQSKLQIEDSIFWIGFSFILILFSIFPGLAAILARIAGTYTTANFIFLSVIFLLIVKMFHMSLKMSLLETRVKELVQEMALAENRRRDGREPCGDCNTETGRDIRGGTYGDDCEEICGEVCREVCEGNLGEPRLAGQQPEREAQDVK